MIKLWNKFYSDDTSPEELLLELAKNLKIDELVRRIENPKETDPVSNPKALQKIAPLVYKIWNQTKSWIIAVLASHVHNISSTRSYWVDVKEVLDELWIKLDGGN